MATAEMVAAEIVQTQAVQRAVTLEHAPAIVLEEASKAAAALKDVISRKPEKVVMNGEQYLEFEDWQTIGRFYGITAALVGEPEFVEFPGGISGFRATAIALQHGHEISRASAHCLNDEEKWSTRPKYAWVYLCRDGSVSETDPGPDNIVWEPNPKKPGKSRPKKERRLVGEERVPLFQLASMAQTRANAKVLSNVLRWVAVLAGYRTTPAEEVQDMADAPRDEAPARAEREPGQDDDAPRAQAPAQKANGNGHAPKPGETPCPQCGKPAIAIKQPRKDETHYCGACKLVFSVSA